MGRLIARIWFMLVMLPVGNIQAQEKLETDQVLSFFSSLYNYDFPGAEEKLRQVRLTQPGQPQTLLCESNYYWWLMMTGMEDASTLSRFEQANQAVIEAYAEKDPAALRPHEVFSVIHGYAYQTRYALHNKKHLEGIANLKKILPFLKVALDQPRLNARYRFVAGLYHYLAAVTVEEHPILRPFFSLAPPSDKALGYELLSRSASSEDPLIQTEAAYFLMKINLEIADLPDAAIRWSKVLAETYPDNILYQYYLLNSYVARGLRFSSNQVYRHIQELSSTLPGLTPAQRRHFQHEGKESLKKLK